MKLLGVSADIASTIADIRIVAPLQALSRQQGHALRLCSLPDCRLADLEWADVLVLQRGLDGHALRLAQRMHRSGGTVVYDIDDLLTDPAPHLQHAARLRSARPWIESLLAEADAVSVSTERLGQALAGHTRHWHVVPNFGIAVDAPVPSNADAAVADRSRAGAPVTLLFASSDRVQLDGLAAALNDAQRRVGASFQVVAVGPVAHDLQSAGVAVHAMPSMPRVPFLQFVRSLPSARAIVPVGATAFDAAKSAIKFYDYALAGVPTLCSDRPPYRDAVRHGVTGWTVDDTEAGWAQAIDLALRDPARMAALAQAAAAEVAQAHGLQPTVDAWHVLLTALPRRAGPARAAVPAWQRAPVAIGQMLRRINRSRLARRARRQRPAQAGRR